MKPIRRLFVVAMFLTTLCFAAFSAGVMAQEVGVNPESRTSQNNHGALIGRLEDNSGQPMGGILVELHAWDGEMMNSTVTGTDGAFRFDGIGIGQYILHGVVGQNAFNENLNFNGSPMPLEVRLGEHSDAHPRETPTTPPGVDRVSVNDLAASPDARKKLNKAVDAFRHNNLDKALQLTDEALKKDGRWARAWLLRGMIHQQTRSFAEARQDFEAATRADPGNGEALAELGQSYTRDHDWPRADFYLQRATTVAPNQWQGWFELSRLQLLQGKYPAAASSARRALEATPPAPVGCRYFLGTAEAALGHLMEAARQFRLFLGSNPPPSRAADDAAHKLQLIEAGKGPAAQPAAKQP